MLPTESAQVRSALLDVQLSTYCVSIAWSGGHCGVRFSRCCGRGLSPLLCVSVGGRLRLGSNVEGLELKSLKIKSLLGHTRRWSGGVL